MNAPDLAQDTAALAQPLNIARENLVQDEIVETWTRLVRGYYPNLAVPIARALAQRAAQGPYGDAMQSITKGLARFEQRSILDMTGSELQMLSALLMNLSDQAQRLLNQVNTQWGAK